MSRGDANERATVHDVAALSGVSAATVSRFLRGQRARSAEAIQAAVDQLGYKPSVEARALKTGRRYYVGVVVPDIGNPYFGAVVKGMESALRDSGYRILLANTDEDSARESDILADMSRRADGLILAPTTEGSRAPLAVREGPPMVFIDRDVTGGDRFDSVLVDNYDGGRQAAEHLLSLGHTRIAGINAALNSTPGRTRRAGFVDTLATAGIEIPPEYDRIGDFREASGYQQTLALLALPTPPTAIFTANDLMTLGACKALRAMRVDVPRQVSLIGFDDLDFGELMAPPLTVIDRPTVTQGVLAMRLLLGQLENPEADRVPRRIVLDVKLIERGSTAGPA